MRRVIAVLVLSACNQIWDLDSTEQDPDDLVGARCAPDQAPRFTKGPFPMTGMTGCHSYHTDSLGTYAVAECSGTIRGGPVDAMAPLALMSNAGHDMPRMTPDGALLYVRSTSAFGAPLECGRAAPAAGDESIQIFTREGSVWKPSSAAGPEGPFRTSRVSMSSPWRSTPRRVLLVESNTLFELEETGSCAGWDMLNDAYAPAALGATSIADPYFSPEGNRLVFVDGKTLRYADRPFGDPDHQPLAPPILPFEPRGEIALPEALDDISTPYLTPNCERLYYTSGGTVYYVEN